MIAFQTFHISRCPEHHFSHREAIQQHAHDTVHVVFRSPGAVHCYRRHVILFPDLPAYPRSSAAVRFRAVHYHYERFAEVQQLCYDAFFCTEIAFPHHRPDGPVGSDDYPHGGMVLYDFLCADLGCTLERYLLFVPRRRHHPGFSVLSMACSSRYHVTHTIHQPYSHLHVPRKTEFCCIRRDEFRFGGGHCPAGAALGHLIQHPLLLIDVRYARQHHKLHESLYKCGFSSPYGADYAYVDVAACPFAYALINVNILQNKTSPYYQLQIITVY